MGRGQAAKAPASTFIPYRGPRCALTGEPLVNTSRVINIGQRHSNGKPDNRSVPKALHTQQMITPDHYVDDMLGDLEWSKRFSTYIQRVKPNEYSRALHLWYRWESYPWLVQRAYEDYRNTRAVDAALALYRDRLQWHEIYEQWHCTLAWIEEHYRRITALVRSTYLLDERADIAFYGQK